MQPMFSSFHYLKTCSPGGFMAVILSSLSGGFLYFKMWVTVSQLFHRDGFPSPPSIQGCSFVYAFVIWPVCALNPWISYTRRDGQLFSHSFLLTTSSQEWFHFTWKWCCHKTFHNSLRARRGKPTLEKPEINFCLRCAIAFGLTPGKVYFGEYLILLMCS